MEKKIENLLLLAGIIIGCVFLAFIVVVNNGNVVYAFGCIVILLVVFITFYRLEWGLYLLITFTMIADGYDIAGLRPFTYTIFYLLTFNVIFHGLKIGVLTPMEVHLVFFILVWVLTQIIKRQDIKIKSVPVGYAGSFFFIWLIVSVIYGNMKGGDGQMALWEIRALVYFGILFFLVPQIITKKEQVRTIFTILIFALTFKALQAIERFIRLGFNFGGLRALANHEDPLFIISLLILLVMLVIVGGDAKQRKILMWVLFPLIFGFYLANRRATYAAFAVSILVLIVLFSKDERRKILKPLAVFSVIFVVYLVLYWNSYGRMAVIASAVRSVYLSTMGETEQMNYEDYTSGLARDHENYNLAVTYRKSPVFGIGFGNQHEWAMPVFGEYALKGYITHNEILWLLTKTGAVGFFLFFFFLNAILIRGSTVYMRLKDPYLKSVCAVCLIAVFGQIVVSYVDMQLTFFRNMVHLGLLTGLIPCLEKIDLENSIEADISN
jgi:hypothetical protein